jgi:two-component system response regulator EvgA
VPATLLIVDDHAAFRAAARRLLEQDGYEVVGEAGDGQAALAAARDLRPDVVLLDVHMPGIDGFEVARRLSERADAPAVVMVSSRDGADFGRLVAQSGARGFIGKLDLSGPALDAVLSAGCG